jgi:Fe-S oxidoreductase
MGTVNPRLHRRRGTQGLYAQPRNVLNAIPGIDFVEMIRTRENAFCCGAGRGTKEAFPTLASSSAEHRLEEVKEIGAEVLVSACPWCKNNFASAASNNGGSVKVMDFSELILASLDA